MLKINLRILVFFLFSFVLIYSPLVQVVQAIGVQPMVLDFEGKPGEQYQFEISLFPELSSRVVYLSLFQPIQSLDGSLIFLEGDEKAYPPLGWVQLDKERILVPPGEATKVQGTITIPFGAGGSHSVIVMVEPAVEDNAEGVTVIVRYAVRLTINVDRPGLRSDLKILQSDLVADENGKPVLMVQIKNPSQFRFPISGESTLRDENRRLVERVKLKPLAAWESGQDSYAIYPHTELLLIAPITEPVYEGKYYLQTFLSYDTSKQAIKTQELIVEEAEFITTDARSIAVDPHILEATIQPGGASTLILQLENRHNEEFRVTLGAGEINADYAHSAFTNLEFEIRGEQVQELKARGRGRSIILVRVPRETALGGYYGNINVHVATQEGEVLESYEVPLTVIVGKEWKKEVTAHGVAVQALEEEYLFSVAVENSGDIHLEPRGTLEIRDENDDVINIVRLEMLETNEVLLPNLSGFLTAAVHQDYILPGTYTATVQVFEAQERVGFAEFPLVIDR